MRARLLIAVAVAIGLVATSLNAGANEAAPDAIKSRPAAADAQKYRPKHGCFGTGTRDAAGNAQMVCR
ncbi:hypothetical protein [Bradyrhizobium sp. 1]|uniref:hypothetical protein n=1 Tax=Bradyrhizobium sp. 1 TaxID=241591 RepID=UPI001FF80119|nr:hypothetical protein [Bradyrhizobium sp. 1]MCK1394853.1 hypothetical protein [Bradyrhizobium sp. 1]